jgi:hypothetical protein
MENTVAVTDYTCTPEVTLVEEDKQEEFEESYNGLEFELDRQGIWGTFERIPLWIKIAMWAMIANLGVVVMGIVLVVVTHFSFAQVNENTAYLATTFELNKLAIGINGEYDASIDLLVTGNSSNAYANLILQRKLYDNAFTEYNTQFLPAYAQYQLTETSKNLVEKVKSYPDQVPSVRNNSLSPNTTVLGVIQFFDSYLNAILNLADNIGNVLAVETNSEAVLYATAIRFCASIRRIIYIGTLQLKQASDINVRVEYQRALATYEAVDGIMHTLYFGPSGNIYKSYVGLPNEQLSLNYAYQLADYSNTTTLNYTEWYNTTKLWLQNYDALADLVRTTTLSEDTIVTKKQIFKFWTAVLVPILFFIFNVLAIYFLSFSVTGPWRRKNRRQEETIKKFVPSSLLSMIKCKTIADVTIGKHAQRKVTFVMVRIKPKQEHSQDIVKRLMRLYEYLGPIVRDHHGFVHQYAGDGFMCVFKSEKSAVHACEAIQLAMSSYNQLHPHDVLELLIVAHTAKVIACAIGEESRLSGAFISDQLFMNHIIRFGLSQPDAQLKILLTKELYKSVKREIENVRYLTPFKHGKEMTSLYEIFNENEYEKGDNKLVFKEACKLAEDFHTVDALHKFYECGGDSIVQKRIGEMKRKLVIEKLLLKIWTLEDTLQDPVILSNFKEFCASEKNDENILLWEQIEIYKKMNQSGRDSISKTIERYLSGMNLNQVTKQQVLEQRTNELVDDKFKELQCELVVLMKDSFARFKEKKLSRALAQII